MRKIVIALIMAVVFAAAALVPATTSAMFKGCVLHNETHEIVVSTFALQSHVDHGDTLLTPDCEPLP